MLQCAIAAGAAWFVATDIVGHERPFFAPIAAVVALGVGINGRLRRATELVAGVTVGVGVGDLLIAWIGSGPWQIALVVVLAMSLAVLLDGGPIIAAQAGSSAVLVATLMPPGGGAGVGRMLDAAVGGLMGIAAMALIPVHPVSRPQRDAAGILSVTSEVLARCADGLHEQNAKCISEALATARGLQSQIDKLRSDLQSGREISRVSPMYWRQRDRLRQFESIADPIDNVVRNVRVLARRSLSVVRNDEVLDPRLIRVVEELGKATDFVRLMVIAPPDGEPTQADAARELRRVANLAKLELVEVSGLSAHVVLAQVRSTIVDLLQVAGLSRISALATLPQQ